MGQGLSQHCCRLSAPVVLNHFRSCIFTLTQALPCLVTMPSSLLCLVSPFMPVPHRRHIFPRAGLYTSLLLLALSLSKLSLLPFLLSMIFLEKSIYLSSGPIKPIQTATAPPACSGLPFTYALQAVCTGPFFSKTSPLSSIKKCQRLCNFNLSLFPLMPILKTIHLKQKIQR